ncbi:MAG: leucine-rich repeat protein [Eubacteriales bacterium]|nr:leucine-rich repeat protein [Eubacteriales bacterium]
MKTFTKKSLSLVLAMLMALSALTTGTVSVFAEEKPAQYYDNICVSGTASNGVSKEISFTAPKTGYYSVILTKAPQKENGSTPSVEFEVNEKIVDEDEGSSTENYGSDYSYGITRFYSVVNNVLTYTNGYLPAQDMVNLVKGRTYTIEVVAGANTNAYLTIVQSDFLYYLDTYYDRLTYNSKLETTVNPATGKEEQTEMICPYTESSYYSVGICARIIGYDGTSTNVAIPASITGYPVKSVSLSNTITPLKNRITTVSIPDGVEDIYGMSRFYSLSYINFPSSLKSIGDNAFAYCHSITGRITIPSGVEYVGDYAFYDTGASSVEITNLNTEMGVQSVGYTEILNTATADPSDTTSQNVNGFLIVAPAGSLASKYAAENGFTSYDRASCIAGNHPYSVKKKSATLFATGYSKGTCPVCGASYSKTAAKKTFKISSVKSSKRGTIVVKAPKQSGITGYQIQYSTSSKFTKSTTKTVTVKTTKALSKTISGLKAGKKYYVRVRATGKTSSGKTAYSKFTPTKSIKVKK